MQGRVPRVPGVTVWSKRHRAQGRAYTVGRKDPSGRFQANRNPSVWVFVLSRLQEKWLLVLKFPQKC